MALNFNEYNTSLSSAVIAQATAAAEQDNATYPGEGNKIALVNRAFDNCMDFFQENEGDYWNGTGGWWNRDMLYLYIATYAERRGELHHAR